MNGPARQGITRGYAAMMIFGVVCVALALTIAGWGMLTLATGAGAVGGPDAGVGAVPLIVLAGLLLLALALWRQTIRLLKGRRSPHWAGLLGAAVGAVLIWIVAGRVAGWAPGATWGSGHAWLIAPVWLVAGLLHWALLDRRINRGRGRPRWPWEREDDLGPDWSNYGLDPWHDGPAGTEPGTDPDDADGSER